MRMPPSVGPIDGPMIAPIEVSAWLKPSCLGRERVAHDRLPGGDQAAAAQALQNAEEDQLVEGRRDTAQHRRDREADDRCDVVVAPAEDLLQPRRERDDDDRRNDVGGDDPRAFVEVGAHIALNRGQRHVDDGRVQHLKQRCRHHADDDQPAAEAEFDQGAVWMVDHRLRKDPHKTDRTVCFVKGSKRRAAILASTAPMFNQRGYAGTSIAEILEATSLEKGGLYNHFSSKEELAVASFEYAWQEVNAYFARTLHGIESGGPRLRAYVDAFEQYVKRPVVLGGCPLVNSALEADDALPFLLERVRAAFREMRSFVRHQVQRGVEKGHFRAETDVDAVTDFTIACLDGAIVLARGMGSRASLGRVLGVLRTWLNSI